MFAVVYAGAAVGPAMFDPEVGINFAMMVHGGQEFRWGPVVVAGDEITTTATVKDISDRGGMASTCSRSVSREPARRDRLHRHLDNIVRGVDHVKQGDAIELKVTPDPYVTVRYAGASGDFNPIHIDEEFAKQVGLPGRILHGLWTMAQVARAHTEAAGGPEKLKRLSVQFRGMGVLGEEIVVIGHRRVGRRRDRDRRLRGRAGGQPDHPQRARPRSVD